MLIECGKLLLRNGYRVKVLNTINLSKSMHYNPFAYPAAQRAFSDTVTTARTRSGLPSTLPKIS